MKISVFIKKLASGWSNNKISSLSAALAYYSLFSLTPLILICVALTGIFFGQDAARGEILRQINDLVGNATALQIQSMIESANKPTTGILAQLLGWIILILAASGAFSEMQSGLNIIWGVKANPRAHWYSIIKQRLLSFSMVLVISFLLLVSLILSVIFASIGPYLNNFLHIGLFEIVSMHIISFLIVILLFALIFKILPDAMIQWKDVWLGATITALLFHLGKFLLAVYISKTQIATTYGAAGSLIILLVWVYYSAQIFFIGAEITKIFACYKDDTVVPKRNAILTNKHADAC